MDVQLLTIGGVSMPAPTSYHVTYSDLDNSDTGRAENGKMYRNRVRSNIAKIEAQWKNLTATQTTRVINAITPAKVSVTYFFGSSRSATMYAGDKSCELASIQGDGSSRWNVSFNLIQY